MAQPPSSDAPHLNPVTGQQLEGPTVTNPPQTVSVPGLDLDAAASLSTTKKLRFLDLMNISIGFFGIQFGWAIQMGKMPVLLEKLGADPFWTAVIFLAGPVTGILVQPIVGTLSDNCASKLGRRRPFLIAGALLTAFCLIAMPHSGNLMMAAILLWLLDASINVTQGPYRAMVPDVVHDQNQQATTYSLMSFTIGLGAVTSFLVGFGIAEVETLFYLGATAILIAMGWTVITTPETPVASTQTPQASVGNSLGQFVKDTVSGITAMPKEGMKLCMAHAFTWFGLGCLFIFFSQFVPHNIFSAHDSQSALYDEGARWASLCYAVNNTVCFLFSMIIGGLCKISSKKWVHTFGLVTMGAAMASMAWLTTPTEVMIAMGVIGMGWATTLSLPFALLADHVPKGKEGLLMGTFNMFIAAPMFLTSLVSGAMIEAFGGDRAIAMVLGGVSIAIAVVLLQFVHESKPPAIPATV